MENNKLNSDTIWLIAAVLCLVLAVGWWHYKNETEVKTAMSTMQIVWAEQDRQENIEQTIKRTEVSMADTKEKIRLLEEAFPQLKHRMLSVSARLEAKTIAAGNRSRLLADDADADSYSASSFDVTAPSLVTAYELDQVLADTPMAGLGQAFVEAEADSHINAMFLLSLAVHESDWGYSDLSVHKNNLFGFGAYDSNPYHGAMVFTSKEECVKHVAAFLRDHYIDGDYYRGTTIRSVNEMYASDWAWGEKIFRTMQQIDGRIQALGLS